MSQLILLKKKLLMAGVEAGEEIPSLAHVEGKTDQNLAAAASHTWSVAMSNGSGSYRMLVLAIGLEGNTTAPTITGATYNGVAGTMEASAVDSESGVDNRLYVFTWKGDDLPSDTSNHDLVVTPSASTAIVAAVDEYVGVADQVAEDIDTSDVDPADDMSVTSSEGALVYHALAHAANNATFTQDNNQTERAEVNGTQASTALCVCDLIGVSAGSVTSGITASINGPRVAQICLSFAVPS